MAKVTLYDELTFRSRDDGRLEFSLQGLPCGPSDQNLVVRAAEALRPHCPRGGADVHLHKRIPAGAGLGGGSSDAAMTLAALNRLWDLGLGRAELAAIGLTLGSDVPVFFGGPASRMTGRGQIVAPAPIGRFAAVLLAPPLHSSTAAVYRAYDEMGPRDIVPLEACVLAAQPPSKWPAVLRNDLFAPACRAYPELTAWFNRFADAVGGPVHLTGSGSGLFALADDVGQAIRLYQRLDGDLQGLARVVQSNGW